MPWNGSCRGSETKGRPWKDLFPSVQDKAQNCEPNWNFFVSRAQPSPNTHKPFIIEQEAHHTCLISRDSGSWLVPTRTVLRNPIQQSLFFELS